MQRRSNLCHQWRPSLKTVGLLFVLICCAPVHCEDSYPVGVPLFHFRNGSTYSVGKCFAIKWFGTRNLLLCPLHLLSPGGGYPSYVEPRTVPDVIASVDIQDLLQRNVIATAQRGLLKRGSPVENGSGNLTDDLMAFDLPSPGALRVFALSSQLPPIGTRVSVLSKRLGSNDVQPDRYAGSVSKATATGISVKLDEPLDAFGSSGAPVIDAHDQIVGMLVGTGDDARTIVDLAPASSIYQRLYTEIGH